MKIVEIQFSNVNNLKGDHLISFDSEPLNHAGIFAIIGPTGSGKSTILDVITLALFNRIPRFKSAISKNQLSDLGSVMTHHTDHAKASITYEINGHRYTSKWEISKTRNGTLRDYRMEIQNNLGDIIEEKKSDVPKRNEVIIGLSYDQFVKSIILSQGQFSKFLKADKHERGELLEQLTGTNIYRKIGIAAYQKLKQKKEALALQLSLLEDLTVMGEDERKEIIQQKENLESLKKKKDIEIAQFNVLKQVNENLTTSKKEFDQAIISRKTLNESKEKLKPAFTKLKNHHKVSHLQGDLSLYRKATEHRQNTLEQLSNYQNNLKATELGITKSIEEIQAFIGQPVNLENYKTRVLGFVQEVIQMDSELENLKSKGEDIRIRTNQLIDREQLTISKQIPPNDAIEQLTKENVECSNLLTEMGIDKSASKDKIQSQIQKFRLALQGLTALEHSLANLQELKEKDSSEQKIVVQFKSELTQVNALLKKSNSALESTKAHERTLEKRKEDQIKIANLTQLRTTLKASDPCPLCGSLDHPYSAHAPDNTFPEIEKELNNVGQKKQIEFDSNQELIKRLARLQNSIDHSSTFLARNQINITKQSGKVEELKRTIPSEFYSHAINDSIGEIISKTKSDIRQNEKALSTIDKIKINGQLSQEFQMMNEILLSHRSKSTIRKERFKGQNAAETSNRMTDKIEHYVQEKGKCLEGISTSSKELKEENELLQKTENVLSVKIKELNILSIDELAAQLLPESEVLDLTQKEKNMDHEHSSISAKIETLEKQIHTLEQKNKSNELDLETIIELMNKAVLVRDQSSEDVGKLQSRIAQDDQIRSKRNQRSKDIETLLLDVQKWSIMDLMIGDAKGNKFANFAQGLTLKNLLAHANQRLTKLTDRYLLNLPKDDGMLTVVDSYQANTSRAVSTLSGGETFLISLALALSLSDMASRNVRLESLFIDEGFGTLDYETLDTAMDTLERLQTESQKTVGVISHVEALKERINVQIKLEKNALGYSTIHILG